jgi:ubiquinone/menaquinone biosynthesis C-methylase UbiE
MSIAEKLKRIYFDSVYNRVYDSTTAKLNRYRKLQSICVSKLELKDGDKVLCVGLGTGNEIWHILQQNRKVRITGVDYSRAALRKALRKALLWGGQINVCFMDAEHLQFPAGSFDKLLCIHVMDFIQNAKEATRGMIQVLKDEGQFVITYPSAKEDLRMAVGILKDSMNHSVESGKLRIIAFFESLAPLIMGILYAPLTFCPNKTFYSRGELEAMFTGLTSGHFHIDEDPVYHDFIVYGRK